MAPHRSVDDSEVTRKKADPNVWNTITSHHSHARVLLLGLLEGAASARPYSSSVAAALLRVLVGQHARTYLCPKYKERIGIHRNMKIVFVLKDKLVL